MNSTHGLQPADSAIPRSPKREPNVSPDGKWKTFPCPLPSDVHSERDSFGARKDRRQDPPAQPLKRRKLNRLYSYIGRHNFISCALRAAQRMNERAIRRQIKPHWKKLEDEVETASAKLLDGRGQPRAKQVSEFGPATPAPARLRSRPEGLIVNALWSRSSILKSGPAKLSGGARRRRRIMTGWCATRRR